MKTTRTTKKTSLALLALCLLIAGGSQAQKNQEPYAIVRGSVFLESGFALPGAKVVLSPKEKPSKKLQEQISSPRGEFAFRVPPGPASYLLTVSMKGFEPASKEVDVVAQEEINKTFSMLPASKK